MTIVLHHEWPGKHDSEINQEIDHRVRTGGQNSFLATDFQQYSA
jgi:hypothetical protein